MKPTHVLVPLDGSPLAEKALKHALSVFDCQITVLSITPALDAGMAEGTLLEREGRRETAAEERTAQVISSARADVSKAEQPIETVCKNGNPAEEILEYVAETDVDHIVMGGHGGESGRLTRRLLGTVSTAVVGEAPVSVTVVR